MFNLMKYMQRPVSAAAMPSVVKRVFSPSSSASLSFEASTASPWFFLSLGSFFLEVSSSGYTSSPLGW